MLYCLSLLSHLCGLLRQTLDNPTLYFLSFHDHHPHVDYSNGWCTCFPFKFGFHDYHIHCGLFHWILHKPSCCLCVFLPSVGPFPLIKSLTLLPPFDSKRTQTQSYTIHSPCTLSTLSWSYKHNTLMCWKKEIRKIHKIMETMPSYRMVILHQIVCGLVGTAYWGDPINVGKSNIINI